MQHCSTAAWTSRRGCCSKSKLYRYFTSRWWCSLWQLGTICTSRIVWLSFSARRRFIPFMQWRTMYVSGWATFWSFWALFLLVISIKQLGFAQVLIHQLLKLVQWARQLGSWRGGALKAKGINNSSFVDIGSEKWPQQSQLMRPNILICVTRNKIFCFRDTADILIVKYFYIIKIGA